MKQIIFLYVFCLLTINTYSQQWYPMGNIDTLRSFNGKRTVQGITSFNNSLIVGGFFKKEGATILNGVAKWGGNNWLSMGLGTWELQSADSGANGGRGLITYHNILYCGGGFSGAGGGYVDDPTHYARGIAKWSGTDFGPLIAPYDGFDNGVAGVGVYKNNLYVGGPFGHSRDPTGNHLTVGITKWNDTVFTSPGQLSGSIDAYVSAFTTFNNKLITGGWFENIDGVSGYNNIAAYNDTAWSPMGDGLNWGVFALTVYNGELYAGGTFISSHDGTTPINNIAKWTGSTWVQVGEGLGLSTDYNDTVLCLCVDSVNNKLYAGGTFTQTGLGVPARHLAEWNGTNWVEVGGGTDDFVWSLFAKNGNLYVGGEFTHVGAGIPANLIACWGSNPNGVGEKTIDKEHFKLYPNPNNGQFQLDYKLNEGEIGELRITDVTGRLIAKYNLNINQTGLQINQTTLNNGVYLYQVLTNGKLVNSDRLVIIK